MASWEQFNEEVVLYLERIEAIPYEFLNADREEFILDLYNVCSKNNTQWYQEQFMFDKYGTENLDFKFVITATNSALSNINHDLSDKKLLSRLINIGEVFLVEIASDIPIDLAHIISSFVVNKSSFFSDFGMVRASLDACAAEWEEYPLPKFEWLWTELEKELIIHKKRLPEHLLPQSSTTYGDRDLARWRKEILNESDAYWIKTYLMKDLRKIQKEFNLKPSRTKKGLIEAIIELYPVPENIQKMIDDRRNSDLYRIDEEKISRKNPLSERYKRHLIRLVQTRVDSFFVANYSLRNPSNILDNEYSQNNLLNAIRHRRLIIYETCNFCGNKKKIINQNNLPPFSLLCSCKPPYCNTDIEFSLSKNIKPSPLLEKELNNFFKANIYNSGLGFKLPTEQDIERFINASIKDNENSKTVFNKIISSIKRILFSI